MSLHKYKYISLYGAVLSIMFVCVSFANARINTIYEIENTQSALLNTLAGPLADDNGCNNGDDDDNVAGGPLSFHLICPR